MFCNITVAENPTLTSEDMDRVLPQTVHTTSDLKAAGCFIDGGITRNGMCVVASNTGVGPCYISETITRINAAPTSSTPNISPHSRPDVLVGIDAVPVVFKATTDTKVSRVYIIDTDVEQRLSFLNTQNLENIRRSTRTDKADGSIALKGIRGISRAGQPLEAQPKHYYRAKVQDRSMEDNASVLEGCPKTCATRDPVKYTSTTACDKSEKKEEQNASSFIGKQTNLASKIAGDNAKRVDNMGEFMAKQMNHDGKVRVKKSKAKKKKMEFAKKGIDTKGVRGEIAGTHSRVNGDKGSPGFIIDAHVARPELFLSSERLKKHRGKASERVKANGKWSSNNITITLSMRPGLTMLDDSIIDRHRNKAGRCLSRSEQKPSANVSAAWRYGTEA